MKIIVTETLDGTEVGLGPFEESIAEEFMAQLLAQNASVPTSMIEYVTTDKMGIYL